MAFDDCNRGVRHDKQRPFFHFLFFVTQVQVAKAIVNVQAWYFLVLNRNDFPDRVAFDHDFFRVGIVLHDLGDTLGHCRWIGERDGHQDSLTFRRYRQYGVGNDRDALTQMGNDLIVNVDLWSFGIFLQTCLEIVKESWLTRDLVDKGVSVSN